MGHMTLTTPTWGIVSHYKANRLASVVSYVQNLKSLAVVAVADTSGGGGENSKMSRDPDHAPFTDDLSAGWDLLPSAYRPNLKFLTDVSISKL